MRASAWGRVDVEGTVAPREAISTGGHLVVASSVWWEPMISVVGLRLDPRAARAEEVGRRQLPGVAPKGREAAYRPGLANVAAVSFIEAGEGRVYLVCGRMRLLLAADTGVLAEVRSHKMPVGMAGVWGGDLVVPEGRELVGHDGETLAVRWRRPAPEEMFSGGARPAGGLWWLRRQRSSGAVEALLYDLERDVVHEVPDAGWHGISSTPVVFGSLAVLSCGGGAGERLIGFSLERGEVAWEAETPPPNPNYFKAPAPAPRPVDPAAVAHGEHVIAGSQLPSIDARVAATGELVWRLGLAPEPDRVGAVGGGQPAALAVFDDTLWVGTHGGRILCLDASTGAVKGEIAHLPPDRPYGAGPPENLLEMPGVSGSSAVLAVTPLKTIFGIHR